MRPFFLEERMADKYCKRATGDVAGSMGDAKGRNIEQGMVTDGADLDEGYSRVGSAERGSLEKMNIPGVGRA